MIYEREERPLKEVYSDLLVEYGRKDPRIVIVEADLMKSGSTDKFQQEFPDRAFDVGVAEANMICVAVTHGENTVYTYLCSICFPTLL